MWRNRWFKPKASKHPKAVGHREYEKALESLRKVAGFDLDAFLKTVDDRSLFTRPMGPTPVCLSINEISAFGRGKNSELSMFRVENIKNHLLDCDSCRTARDLYNALETKEWSEEPEPVIILSGGRIMSDFRERFAEITIGASFPHRIPNFEIDPSSVSITGFIQANGCTIVNSWLEEPSHEKFFTARVTGTIGPINPNVREVCDWLEIRGKTTLGQTFYSKSLLNFKVS